MQWTSRCFNARTLCFSTIFLFICFYSTGLRAEILPENFQGTFSVDPSVISETEKGREISAAFTFTEETDGKRYNIYAHNLFIRLYPQAKYSIKGIVVQKKLPEKPTSDDYRQLVQAVWPSSDPEDVKIASKKVESWIRRTPDKPLLLISTIFREKPAPRREITVGGSVQESRLLQRMDPVYPQKAKEKRIEGKVTMEVLVDEKGVVESIVPKNGPPLLIPAAVAAVQNWRYSPTTIDGEAVPILATVTVTFRLFR